MSCTQNKSSDGVGNLCRLQACVWLFQPSPIGPCPPVGSSYSCLSLQRAWNDDAGMWSIFINRLEASTPNQDDALHAPANTLGRLKEEMQRERERSRMGGGTAHCWAEQNEEREKKAKKQGKNQESRGYQKHKWCFRGKRWVGRERLHLRHLIVFNSHLPTYQNMLLPVNVICHSAMSWGEKTSCLLCLKYFC